MKSLLLTIGFTRPEFFEEGSMCHMTDGSLVVMITTDEDDPSKTLTEPAFWRYQGLKLTQYWRARPRGDHPMHVKVNGQLTYWMSSSVIPNGVAYENFELVQDYHERQQLIFGITEHSPAEFDLIPPLPTTP